MGEFMNIHYLLNFSHFSFMSEKKVPGMSFSFGLPGGMAQLFSIGCGGFDPECDWLGSYGADAADATHASNKSEPAHHNLTLTT